MKISKLLNRVNVIISLSKNTFIYLIIIIYINILLTYTIINYLYIKLFLIPTKNTTGLFLGGIAFNSRRKYILYNYIVI